MPRTSNRKVRGPQKLIASVIKTLKPEAKPYEVCDSTIPGFRLRVQPSGVMTYYYSYRATDGRKNRYRIGSVGAVTPAQARDVAQTLSARVIHGEDVQAAKQHARTEAEAAKLQTLSGFLERQYLPWLQAERTENRATATRQRLESNFIHLMDTPMLNIVPWTLEKWRAEQIKAGKARSTVNRDITTLRAVLSKAMTWKVIDAHPLIDLKPLKTDKNSRIRYLFEDEEERLRGALYQRDNRIKAGRERGNAWRRERGYVEMPSLNEYRYGDHITPMVLLTLNTGLRRGEAFNLQWRDINYQTKTLTVEGSTAKSDQTRHIPLNDEALNVLKAWRDQTDSSGYVFPSRDGGRLDNVRKAWTRLMKDTGITDFRWHDLRHDFASKLVMAGVPLNTVRELLGHSNLNTTLRYAHLAPDHKAAAVEQLSRTKGRSVANNKAL